MLVYTHTQAQNYKQIHPNNLQLRSLKYLSPSPTISVKGVMTALHKSWRVDIYRAGGVFDQKKTWQHSWRQTNCKKKKKNLEEGEKVSGAKCKDVPTAFKSGARTAETKTQIELCCATHQQHLQHAIATGCDWQQRGQRREPECLSLPSWTVNQILDNFPINPENSSRWWAEKD